MLPQYILPTTEPSNQARLANLNFLFQARQVITCEQILKLQHLFKIIDTTSKPEELEYHQGLILSKDYILEDKIVAHAGDIIYRITKGHNITARDFLVLQSGGRTFYPKYYQNVITLTPTIKHENAAIRRSSCFGSLRCQIKLDEQEPGVVYNNGIWTIYPLPNSIEWTGWTIVNGNDTTTPKQLLPFDIVTGAIYYKGNKIANVYVTISDDGTSFSFKDTNKDYEGCLAVFN